MGKVYKKKKRSCPLCKPWKMKRDKKHKAKYRSKMAQENRIAMEQGIQIK